MAKLLSRLGLLAARRPLSVIGSWLLLLAVAAGGFLLGGGALASSLSIPGTPTAVINDQLREKLPDLGGATGTVVFQTADGSSFDAAQRESIAGLLDDISGIGGVERVVDPFATEAQRDAQQQQLDAAAAQLDAARQQLELAPADAGDVVEQLAELDAQSHQLVLGQQLLDAAHDIRTVSSDGGTALGMVVFQDQLFDLDPDVKSAVAAALDDAGIPGVTIDYSSEIAASIAGLIGPGEVIGVIIAALVLIIMLRSLLPTLIPLVSSLIGVGVG